MRRHAGSKHRLTHKLRRHAVAVRYCDGAMRYVLMMKLRYNMYTWGVFDGAFPLKNSGSERCSRGWTLSIENHDAQLHMCRTNRNAGQHQAPATRRAPALLRTSE